MTEIFEAALPELRLHYATIIGIEYATRRGEEIFAGSELFLCAIPNFRIR
jgi:hypothetical protein